MFQLEDLSSDSWHPHKKLEEAASAHSVSTDRHRDGSRSFGPSQPSQPSQKMTSSGLTRRPCLEVIRWRMRESSVTSLEDDLLRQAWVLGLLSTKNKQLKQLQENQGRQRTGRQL